VLSWQGAGFHLEANGTLVSGPVWADVPNGGTSPVTVPINGSIQFFRLANQ
jgi:hypothetical protein